MAAALAQAATCVILDARDRRLARPWETPGQRAERAREFGALLPPAPSEWGGGAR